MTQALILERGRLETLRRLTDGNPRLLVLACRILMETPLGEAIEDLEQLIDEQTPYFKARIEELAPQARKVFHCLADGWNPMLAKEVAEAAKLSSSHASAQIRQLVDRGYAREIKLQGAKRARYEVGDRFYNIYFLLRFSRTNRRRLERLVAFLHELFGASGAMDLDPTYDGSWRIQAEIILRRGDDTRLDEAEEYARRAVDLAPEKPQALHTLSNVLVRRGKTRASLDCLERLLSIDRENINLSEMPGLTHSLIHGVAAGHGKRVRRMLEDSGLVESMEPLWHAVRAELGEELEPLPAEIMDTVREIRQEFSQNRP